MNWFEVIGAGIGGGVGGALAALARSRFPRSMGTVLVPALTIAFAAIGAQIGKSQRVKDFVSPPSRLEVELRKYSAFAESPAFKARLSTLTPDEARQAAQKWSHSGLRRLEAADLDSWNDIRTKIARGSKEVCAGLWTGSNDPRQILAQIDALPDADLQAWARLSTTAMRLEVEASGPAPGDPQALARGLRVITGQLSSSDASRFQRDLQRAATLVGDEACWAMLTVSEGARNLQTGEREPFLRAFASL